MTTLTSPTCPVPTTAIFTALTPRPNDLLLDPSLGGLETLTRGADGSHPTRHPRLRGRPRATDRARVRTNGPPHPVSSEVGRRRRPRCCIPVPVPDGPVRAWDRASRSFAQRRSGTWLHFRGAFRWKTPPGPIVEGPKFSYSKALTTTFRVWAAPKDSGQPTEHLAPAMSGETPISRSRDPSCTRDGRHNADEM